MPFDNLKIVVDGNTWMLQDPTTNKKKRSGLWKLDGPLCRMGSKYLKNMPQLILLEWSVDVNDSQAELKQNLASISV